MLGALGLGLLPRWSLIAAGAVVVSLLTMVGVQSCQIRELRDDLAEAEAALSVAETANGACLASVRRLEDATRQLAQASEQQNQAVAAYVAAGERAQQASAEALRQAEHAAATHRQVAVELAEIVRRKAEYVRPGECEAAAALRVVRERWQ